MRILKILGFGIFYIIASPFIIIGTGIVFLNDRITLNRFIKENNGKKYFIYSNKHNWGTFIKNNVLDILPPDLIPMCFEEKGTKRFVKRTNNTFRSSRIIGSSKMPYFCIIDNFKIINYSIRDKYLKIRFDNKKNDNYRNELKELMNKIK